MVGRKRQEPENELCALLEWEPLEREKVEPEDFGPAWEPGANTYQLTSGLGGGRGRDTTFRDLGTTQDNLVDDVEEAGFRKRTWSVGGSRGAGWANWGGIRGTGWRSIESIEEQGGRGSNEGRGWEKGKRVEEPGRRDSGSVGGQGWRRREPAEGRSWGEWGSSEGWGRRGSGSGSPEGQGWGGGKNIEWRGWREREASKSERRRSESIEEPLVSQSPKSSGSWRHHAEALENARPSQIYRLSPEQEHQLSDSLRAMAFQFNQDRVPTLISEVVEVANMYRNGRSFQRVVEVMFNIAPLAAEQGRVIAYARVCGNIANFVRVEIRDPRVPGSRAIGPPGGRRDFKEFVIEKCRAVVAADKWNMNPSHFMAQFIAEILRHEVSEEAEAVLAYIERLTSPKGAPDEKAMITLREMIETAGKKLLDSGEDTSRAMDSHARHVASFSRGKEDS